MSYRILTPPSWIIRTKELYAEQFVFDKLLMNEEPFLQLLEGIKRHLSDVMDAMPFQMYLDRFPLHIKFRLNSSRWALFFTANHRYFIFWGS